MDNSSIDVQEIKFDPSEQKSRYIGSRNIEKSMLHTLKDVYVYLLNPEGKFPKSYLEGAKDLLESDFGKKYDIWQGVYYKTEGLFSGAIGEVFARMAGYSILEDFPEVVDAKENTTGVTVLSQPKNESDKIKIEVVSEFGDKGNSKFVKFTFDTSLTEIDKRVSILENEMEKASKIKDEDFNNF